MKKLAWFAAFFILFYTTAEAQSSNTASIHWYSLTDAEKLSKDHPKKILIDIYTDWCGWCKRLDATTWKDSNVVKYVNDHFYAVKLNAESHETIHYKGQDFAYDSDSRMNTIAPQFMSQSGGYPTVTYLDEKFQVLSPVPGYMPPDVMMKVLHYFGDNIYLTTDWNSYYNSKGSSTSN
jgi:thioredoxin-related protein